MKLVRRVWPRALRAALFLVLCSPLARAQSASLEPDSLPSLPAKTPTPDRAGNAESEHPEARRKDPIRVGALLGVGFPRPLAVEGVVKLDQSALLGVEYSALPQITVSDVRASCWAVAGDARVFPLHGAFFFGLRAGRQHISAESSVSAYGYTVPAALTVDTVFVNPRLGFLWTWDPGVTLGIDAGVQIPLSSATASTLPKTTSSAVAGAAASARESLESVARGVGQTTLPTVDLLRVGILF